MEDIGMSKEILLTDETMVGFFHEDEEYGCFSNWYSAEFKYAKEQYKNVEQYMMYQKVTVVRQHELSTMYLTLRRTAHGST